MREKLLAYARLLRLSNGPTAVADVWMGYAVVTGGLDFSPELQCVTLCSAQIYLGGMALNDAVDADRDRCDARQRPIAQGLVPRPAAFLIAFTLLATGLVWPAEITLASHDAVVEGVSLGGSTANWAPTMIAVALAVCVVAYNTPVKRTAAGPLMMGCCRGLNGMLGMSVALSPSAVVVVTPGVVAYVTAITLFAKDEARGGERRQLVRYLRLAVAGIAWMGISSSLMGSDISATTRVLIAVLWGLVGWVAVRGMVAALPEPTPSKIGRGVGIAIQGLVVIDATLAGLYAGPMAGLAILALLPVTMILARWIPQT